MTKEKIAIEYFGASDIGMVRSENQDSFGKFPPDNLDTYSDKGQLFIVADGIGGHEGGKEASSIAVEKIRETYFNFDSNDAALSLRNAIETANKTIHQKSKTSEAFGRMGTTSTIMVLKNNVGAIGQVGDSKVYKIDDNKIEQLTMEHTQLNEMLKEGILTEEEANNYPSKSMLSRALGMEEKVKVDIIDNIPLKEGQTFVICTDGLSKVNKDEILNIVVQNSVKDACSKLINLANERGGKDNVTVQVIKINAVKSLPKPSSAKEEKIKPVRDASSFAGEKKKKNKWLFIIPILIILIVLGFQFGKSFVKVINPNSEDTSDNVKPDIIDRKSLIENNTGNDLLTQANQLLKKGNYEKALMMYLEIQENEPMNLGALEGVNNITAVYLQRADKLKDEKKFSEALKLYLKIQKIQPDNFEVKKAILLCENQVRFSEGITYDNEMNYQVNGVNQFEWSFVNIDKSHYEMDGSSIKFYSTSFEKKSLINFNLNDAAISADIKILSKTGNVGAGILFGYNIYPSGEENYYLLKFDSDNYLLQLVKNNSVEQLLSIQAVNNNNSNERNLRIKCSGNLINIYDGMNLINSWKTQEKIYGRVGIFADKNVQVKFQNILIRGNKQVQVQVQE